MKLKEIDMKSTKSVRVASGLKIVKKNRHYTAKTKKRVVQYMNTSKISLAKASELLGLPASTLHYWRKGEYGLHNVNMKSKVKVACGHINVRKVGKFYTIDTKETVASVIVNSKLSANSVAVELGLGTPLVCSWVKLYNDGCLHEDNAVAFRRKSPVSIHRSSTKYAQSSLKQTAKIISEVCKS